MLIQGIATAALTWAVADHYMGKSTSFLGAYRKVGRSWLGLIGAMLLAFIISIGLFVWLLVPCIGWLTGAGILAFFWLAITPLSWHRLLYLKSNKRSKPYAAPGTWCGGVSGGSWVS